MNTVDFEALAEVAIRAFIAGDRMSLAVAAEFGYSEQLARSYVSRARVLGHPIPYERTDLAEGQEQPRYLTYEVLFQPEEWKQRAACRGLDVSLFFPERGGVSREAKDVCATCPVQPECLDYALRLGEKYGVYGGYSERGRRNLRREIRMDEAS